MYIILISCYTINSNKIIDIVEKNLYRTILIGKAVSKFGIVALPVFCVEKKFKPKFICNVKNLYSTLYNMLQLIG